VSHEQILYAREQAEKQGGEDFAAAVRDTPESAPLTPRERAMLDYAKRLNDRPDAVREEHVVALRAAGLTDAEVLHLNLVVSYFAFANRLTLGLGMIPATVTGLADVVCNPIHATGVGLLLFGLHNQTAREELSENRQASVWQRMKAWFQGNF